MARTPLEIDPAGDAQIRDIVEDFVRKLPDRIKMMDVALSENDFAALTNLAHQLRGAGGSFGFPAITVAAERLEESVRCHERMERLTAKLEELTSICRQAQMTAPKV